MNLNGIHLKNFRIFRDQGFALRPLTVIVGPNSSGKSSIFKALQLLNENIERCDRLFFTDKTHGLGSFELTKTKDAEEGLEISLRQTKELTNPNGHDPKNFDIEYAYNFDRLKNSSEPIAELKEFRLSVNGHCFLKVENVYHEVERGSRGEKLLQSKAEKISKIYFDLSHVTNFLHERGDLFYRYDPPAIEKEKDNEEDKSESEEAGKEKKEGDDNEESESKSKSAKEMLEEDIELSLKMFGGYKANPIIAKKSINEILIPLADTQEIFDWLGDLWEKYESDVDNEKVGRIPVMDRDFIESANKRLKEVLKDLFGRPLPIFSFPAFRGLQKYFYTPSDEKGTLENVIFRFWRNKNEFDLDFLGEWLEKFEIIDEAKADVLTINKLGDLSNTLQIKLDGQNLADYGFGVTQLVPIILTVAGLPPKKDPNRKEEQLLLIEEPESHLHPKLQTKLADFFVEAMGKFKVRFAIETHSEYLIYNLRLKAKESNTLREEMLIHYINAREGDFREITLDENGIMSDDFGDGFTDESSRLLEKFWDF
ncbi:MAG: AAA family ATPase [Bernardetiaceae bacterium]